MRCGRSIAPSAVHSIYLSYGASNHKKAKNIYTATDTEIRLITIRILIKETRQSGKTNLDNKSTGPESSEVSNTKQRNNSQVIDPSLQRRSVRQDRT